jgi:enterochelin esterase-like enzyme
MKFLSSYLSLVLTVLPLPIAAQSPSASQALSMPLLRSQAATLCSDLDTALLQTKDLEAQKELTSAQNICALPTDDVTLQHAQQALFNKDIAFHVDGDVLTWLQRGPGEMGDARFRQLPVLQPNTCCTIQSARWRTFEGSDLWVTRIHLTELQSAMIEQRSASGQEAVWRGPSAPLLPIQKRGVAGQISVLNLKSSDLGEVRRLRIYTPASIQLNAKLPVIILADGAVRSYAPYIEALIDADMIMPVIVVGLLSGEGSIIGTPRVSNGGPLSTVRAQDCIPEPIKGEVSNPWFDRHMNFVTKTVIPYVKANYPASHDRNDWVVTGYSNGGVFAAEAGTRHPEIFGHAWPMSAGMPTLDFSALGQARQKAKFRVSAGYYEPGFLKTTQDMGSGLLNQGYNVTSRWFASGHSSDQWDVAFMDNLRAVFGAPK